VSAIPAVVIGGRITQLCH